MRDGHLSVLRRRLWLWQTIGICHEDVSLAPRQVPPDRSPQRARSQAAFTYDIVGASCVPLASKQAREDFAAGRIDRADVRGDEAIADLVRRRRPASGP